MSKKIGIIIGSLRKESFSKKLGNTLISMAPEGFEFSIVSLDGLPVYNQDFDDNNEAPEIYTKFRQEISNFDGFLFITPEYNRSIPGVLKNALDIGSRPRGKNSWNGKPAAIFSSSPGNLGAFGANHHLRQVLVVLNVPTMHQPEIYISKVHELFDTNGNLVDENTRMFLKQVVDAYIEWFELISHPSVSPVIKI